MKIKGLIDTDFINYKEISMFIAMGTCDWKCCKEANIPITICQNSELGKAKEIEVSTDEIFSRYTSNPLSKAIVLGGLEPMTHKNDIIDLVKYFRDNNCDDTFVIYTGYYKNEIKDFIEQIKQYKNIVMKFGRYKDKYPKRYDEVLGVTLASDNQYGRVIS